MLDIYIQKRFKKDVLLAKKRNKNLDNLQIVLDCLIDDKILDKKFKDHSLKGNYEDCRECHLEPDFLLIYRITLTKLILIRLGSHSDLF